jgi:hypothetical protein
MEKEKQLIKMAARGVFSAAGEGEAFTGFWWGDLRERDHWRDPGVDGRIILR